MSNTLTNLTFTNLAQKVHEAFVANVTPIRAFASNFSDEARKRGDKIKVGFVSAQDAAGDFAGSYTMQDADMEGLDITLNKRKFVSFALTTEDLANMPLLSAERFARQKGFQLAKAVLQDIWSLATQANFGAPVFSGAAATFDNDDVVDIEVACDEADWPQSERGLILKPAYHGALVKDQAIAGDLGVESAGVKSDSRIRRLHNFDLYKSTLIPGLGENLIGMAVHPDAILVAMRALMPEKSSEAVLSALEILTDAETGITTVYREWFDADADETRRVVECSYGRRVGNSAALKPMSS